jgi:hypothetical protein
MALCPSGQKPTIEWQYSGEEKQQIIGADGYATGFKPGQCCHLLYQVQVTTFRANFEPLAISRTPTLYTRGGTSYSPRLPYWGRVLGLRFDDTQKRQNGVSTAFFIDWMDCSGQVRSHSISSNSDVVGWLDSATSITSITVVEGGVDNCGDCVFTVTKNNQVVYTRTKSPCPTVTYTCGEQCPAGSCECTCGTKVCCHHPQTGAVIKSFAR